MTVTELRLEHIVSGETLTPSETVTLHALAGLAPGAKLEVWAKLVSVHVNTLKYRLSCIGAKWGMDPTPGAVREEALRRGYGREQAVPQEKHALATLAAFVGQLERALPAGPLTPFSDGLRAWLSSELSRFLLETAAENAAA